MLLRKAVALVGINLVSVLLANGAHRTDREIHGLKGAVGSVRVETAKLLVSSGKIVEGSRVRTEKRVYDDKGNITWETLYDGDSLAASRYYSYESDGTQVEIAHTRRSSVGTNSVAPRGVFTSQLTWTHKSDASGDRVESSARAADGSVVRRFVYAYDAAGKPTGVAQYAASGGLIQRWVYDDAGDVKERHGFDEKGSQIERNSYTYEYDRDRNWIRRVTSTLVKGANQALANPVEVTYRSITYYPPVGDYQMNGGVIPGGLPKSASQESILSGQATRRIEPVNPALARAHVSGSVVVELTVDEEGDVLSARAISGHPLLTEAALDAAWDWKFSPMLYRGKAVKVIGTIRFNFLL